MQTANKSSQKKVAAADVLKNEACMAGFVARRFHKSVREITFGGCRFDVVSYNKRERLFTLIECKLGTNPTTIGQAFGQILAYTAVLTEHGWDFVNEVGRKLSLSFNRLWQATAGAQQIRVAFYVALTKEACRRDALLQSVKGLLPYVGIVRVNPDGKCKMFIRINGKKDVTIAEAKPVVIKIISKGQVKQTQSRTAGTKFRKTEKSR